MNKGKPWFNKKAPPTLPHPNTHSLAHTQTHSFPALLFPMTGLEGGEKKRKRKFIDHTLVTRHLPTHISSSHFAHSHFHRSHRDHYKLKRESEKKTQTRDRGGGNFSLASSVPVSNSPAFLLAGGNIPYLISSAPSLKPRGKSPPQDRPLDKKVKREPQTCFRYPS